MRPHEIHSNSIRLGWVGSNAVLTWKSDTKRQLLGWVQHGKLTRRWCIWNANTAPRHVQTKSHMRRKPDLETPLQKGNYSAGCVYSRFIFLLASRIEFYSIQSCRLRSLDRLLQRHQARPDLLKIVCSFILKTNSYLHVLPMLSHFNTCLKVSLRHETKDSTRDLTAGYTTYACDQYARNFLLCATFAQKKYTTDTMWSTFT
jgi:hypothetical protein